MAEPKMAEPQMEGERVPESTLGGEEHQSGEEHLLDLSHYTCVGLFVTAASITS